MTHRRGRAYTMTWLTCPQCGEVNFSYRLVSRMQLESVPISEIPEEIWENEREPVTLP